MSESNAERIVEQTIEQRIEAYAGYSPTRNRLWHMTDAENMALVESTEGELALIAARRNDCTCYPKGFISWTKEVKAEQKRVHIEAGRHAMSCPMWVDPSPMYSRQGDSQPSYTLQQRRRDEEAESLDRGGATSLGRFGQVDRL